MIALRTPSFDPATLTTDQARAALFVTDSILEHACGCEIHKATGEGKLLPFEKELIEALLVEWGKSSKKAVDTAVKLIMQNHGEFSELEAQGIIAEVSKTLNASLVPSVEKQLPGLFGSGYKLAKKTVAAQLKQAPTFAFADQTAIKWLSDHHLYWVGTYFEKNLSSQFAADVATGLKQGLGREAIGNRMADFFNDYPGVSAKPDSYWRGLAANGMNRSRNFGQLAEYEDVAVQYMQVVAVMDERTSAICKFMNGKIVPVGAAISQRNRLMTAESPEDVKTIAPWVSASSLSGMSVSEIVNQGVIMPPYHFHCRTTVVAYFKVGKNFIGVRIAA